MVYVPWDPPSPQQESSGEKLRLSLSHTFPREAPVHWKSSVPFEEPTVGLRGRWVYVKVWGESGDVDERYHPAPWDQYPFYVTGTRREVNGRRSCLSHPESPRIRGGATGANSGRLGSVEEAGTGPDLAGAQDHPKYKELRAWAQHEVLTGGAGAQEPRGRKSRAPGGLASELAPTLGPATLAGAAWFYLHLCRLCGLRASTSRCSSTLLNFVLNIILLLTSSSFSPHLLLLIGPSRLPITVWRCPLCPSHSSRSPKPAPSIPPQLWPWALKPPIPHSLLFIPNPSFRDFFFF